MGAFAGLDAGAWEAMVEQSGRHLSSSSREGAGSREETWGMSCLLGFMATILERTNEEWYPSRYAQRRRSSWVGNCRALGHRGFKVSRHQSGRASACLTEVTAGASATPSPTPEPQGG